jgi:integrin alpha FG-GAP repeat containing protein 1
VINPNSTFLTVFLWSNAGYEYKVLEATTTHIPRIDSISPLDFNYDGIVDILVQHWLDSAQTQLGLRVLFGTRSGFFPDQLVLPPAAHPVMIFDANNDLLPDLFGALAGSEERTVWVNLGVTAAPDGVGGSIIEVSGEAGLGPGHEKVIPSAATRAGLFEGPPLMRAPHAFADVDGDCLADMIVMAAPAPGGPADSYGSIEVWINAGSSDLGGYTLKQRVPLPPGVGHMSVQDFDGDGALDLTFPVCLPARDCSVSNQVYILYNKAKPCCGTSKAAVHKSCKACPVLCTRSPEGEYGFEARVPTAAEAAMGSRAPSLLGPYQVVLPREALVYRPGGPESAEAYELNLIANFTAPKLRCGDFGRDGYPDAVSTFFVRAKQKTAAVFLRNVACPEPKEYDSYPGGPGALAGLTGCSREAGQLGRRTFAVTTTGMADVFALADTTMVSFVDLDESGKLDLFVASDPRVFGKSQGMPRMHFFYNNFDRDAFFLKVLGLNGVCPAWCSVGPKFPSPKPLGGNLAGAMFKYSIVDDQSRKRVGTGVQRSQSSYSSFLSPYHIFGLGHISNYVDQVEMGVPLAPPKGAPRGKAPHLGTWLSLVPNSQIAMSPYPRNSPELWVSWTFVTFKGLAWVIIGVLISMIFSGAPIVFFHIRERKEDMIEKKEASQHFAFAAL